MPATQNPRRQEHWLMLRKKPGERSDLQALWRNELRVKKRRLRKTPMRHRFRFLEALAASLACRQARDGFGLGGGLMFNTNNTPSQTAVVKPLALRDL